MIIVHNKSKAKDSSLLCSQHNQNLELFCKEENKLVCPLCVSTNCSKNHPKQVICIEDAVGKLWGILLSTCLKLGEENEKNKNYIETIGKEITEILSNEKKLIHELEMNKKHLLSIIDKTIRLKKKQITNLKKNKLQFLESELQKRINLKSELEKKLSKSSKLFKETKTDKYFELIEYQNLYHQLINIEKTLNQVDLNLIKDNQEKLQSVQKEELSETKIGLSLNSLLKSVQKKCNQKKNIKKNNLKKKIKGKRRKKQNTNKKLNNNNNNNNNININNNNSNSNKNDINIDNNNFNKGERNENEKTKKINSKKETNKENLIQKNNKEIEKLNNLNLKDQNRIKNPNVNENEKQIQEKEEQKEEEKEIKKELVKEVQNEENEFLEKSTKEEIEIKIENKKKKEAINQNVEDFFSPVYKKDGVVLKNENRVATFVSDEKACGSRVYSTGKNDIKLQIDKFSNLPWDFNIIRIGIIQSELRDSFINGTETEIIWNNTFEFRTFWDGGSKKLHSYKDKNSGEGKEQYGIPFKEGDVVTIHINMDERETAFSVNGKYLNVAFNDLPQNVSFFIYAFGKGNQISLI
ncbi:spry domain containing socs box protein [Anaeramoeba flamelloides]|uniref:Spry domain containing socs box protein n=1 Tax=Anaeramoeba flamelloides TaxID=1746091 RepID=A0ABQ8YML6_9EUKA|nr:spry domain containing socs box protein [Anaeramoeba flamelloides]